MTTSKKAIIVGASSGIGLAVARQLLSEGWTLGVCARREPLLKDLEQQAPGRVLTQVIDVTAADAPRRLCQLIDRLGGMDLYLHVAGIGRQNRTLTEDIELSTVQTNAVGFTRMVGEAYRHFARQGHGHLCAVTSIAGTKGLGPAPAYSATKALQNVYLEALAQQARQRRLDIHVTDIRPGFVDTDLLSGDYRYPMKLSPQRVARSIVSAVNRRRHVRVVDWKYRVVTFCWRRCPGWLWRRLKL